MCSHGFQEKFNINRVADMLLLYFNAQRCDGLGLTQIQVGNDLLMNRFGYMDRWMMNPVVMNVMILWCIISAFRSSDILSTVTNFYGNTHCEINFTTFSIDVPDVAVKASDKNTICYQSMFYLKLLQCFCLTNGRQSPSIELDILWGRGHL